MIPEPVGRVVEKLAGYAGARVESERKGRGGYSGRGRGIARGRRGVALAAVFALVVIALAGAAVFAGVASDTGGSHVSVPADNVGPPDHAEGGGPPSHALENIPSHAAAWDVHANAHAGDLEVVVGGTDDGRLSLVFRDEVNHDGREVAVSASTLDDVLGYVPSVAFVEHSSGDVYAVETRESGGLVYFDLREFSSNEVTFSGGITLEGSAATDGTTFSYDLDDLDGVGNFEASFTGVVNSQNREVSWSTSSTETESVTVGGNMDPTGPAGGLPQVTLESSAWGESIHSNAESEYGGKTSGPVIDDQYTEFANTFEDPPDVIEEIHFTDLEVREDGGGTMDIYISEGGPPDSSGIKRETKVYDGYVVEESTEDPHVIELETPYEPSSNQVMLEFETVSGFDQDANAGLRLGGWDTVYNEDGPDWSYWRGEVEDLAWGIRLEGPESAENVEVSTDDGAVTSIGTVPAGGEVSDSIGISSDTGSVSVSGDGDTTVFLEFTEHTETRDATLSVNGETVSYSGTLSDGTTESLAIDPEWLVEGENTVEISLSDPSSGPEAMVGFEYGHDADGVSEKISVESTAWTDVYNASRTYPSAETDPTATFSLQSTALEVFDVETRIDGGEWATVDESDIAFDRDESELVVSLGAVNAGETVTVRAETSKVRVYDGDIRVTDPTVAGDDLETTIEVVEVDAGGMFGIDVTGTGAGDRLHYLSEASFSGETWSDVTASGTQIMRMPDANAGSTATIQTAPVSVVPESGAMEAVVEDAAEPRFSLRQGDTVGAATVDVGYHDTLSGERYVLWDVHQDREVDADRASSPAWFRTDGGDRTYTILQRDAGGGGEGGAAPAPASSGVGMVLVLPAVAFSVGGLWLIGRRLGARGGRGTALLIGGSVVVAVLAAEIVTPRSLTSDVIFAAGDALATGAGAVILGVGVLLGLYGLDQRTRVGVPSWLMALSTVLVVVMSLEAMRPGSILGAVEAALGEVGPALLLMGLLAVVVLLYRRMSPPEITVRGGD